MKRAAALGFGLFAYAAFGAVFAALGLFVANLGVVRGIDDPPTASRGLAIAIDVALVALFGVTHSVMARPAFKRRWTRLIPEVVERSAYVLVTCACFAVLVWQWRSVPAVVWDVDPRPARIAIHAITIAGIVVIVISTFLTDHFDLFGLRQVWAYARGVAYVPVPFQERSLYRHVRHPMMVGVAVWLWATPTMTVGHLIFAVAMSAYIVVGVTFEERDLARNLGAPYEAYRARVRAFLPIRRQK